MLIQGLGNFYKMTKMKNSTKVLWSLFIGALLAVPSVYAINLLWNEALTLAIFSGVELETWKLIIILGSEFIATMLVYAGLIKPLFFDK